MKKMIALFLVFVLALALCACSAEPAEQGTSGADVADKEEASNKGNAESVISSDNIDETPYQVGGFKFYSPKQPGQATEERQMAFRRANDMDGVLVSYEDYQLATADDLDEENRYVVVASAPCSWFSPDDEVKKTIMSTVTLDNIAELTKDQIAEYFNDSFYSKNLLGGMTPDYIDMVFDKSEKVTVNGIDMLKLEGRFVDLKNPDIQDVPFYAYYMIAVTADGNKIPTHYLGIPIDGTIEEVVDYMDTYIQFTELVWQA
jgi:hypothetical protein